MAAWMTQRAGARRRRWRPAPSSIGARSSLSRWIPAPPAGEDRAGDAAAVRELGVRRIRDRVDLELVMSPSKTSIAAMGST